MTLTRAELAMLAFLLAALALAGLLTGILRSAVGSVPSVPPRPAPSCCAVTR
jgi:hypothetical protein